jgi:hypothetical protein
MAAGPPNRRDGKGGLTRARTALLDGDFKRARLIAEETLANPSASENDKSDARAILDATRIDRTPIVAGLVVLAILIVLFAWVFHRAHSG